MGSKIDLYRLQNLVTLLEYGGPTCKQVSSRIAEAGDTLTYTISLVGTGATAAITDSIPGGVTYVPDSTRVQPQVGTLSDEDDLIRWTAWLTNHIPLKLTFAVTVTVTEPFAIVNTASVDDGAETRELTAVTIANGFKLYLPVVMKQWDL